MWPLDEAIRSLRHTVRFCDDRVTAVHAIPGPFNEDGHLGVNAKALRGAPPKPLLTTGPLHSLHVRGHIRSCSRFIGFPWALVLKISSRRSSKHVFLSPFTLHYCQPPRGSILIHQKNWLSTKTRNKRKKIQRVVPWCSMNISLRLPHESCQTVQIQRSKFQWQPSRSSGNSQGCPSRHTGRSACQRRTGPGRKTNAPLEDICKRFSEVCFIMCTANLVGGANILLTSDHGKT